MRVELYPAYRVFLYLDELYNVDLSHAGYYQLRVIPRPSADFMSVDVSFKENGPSALVCGGVNNGIGYSRTIEVMYIEEVLKFGDIFSVKAQLHPQLDFTKKHNLSIDLELWYMDRGRPPHFDLFTFQGRRTVEIELNPCGLVTVARSLYFNYMAPSGFSLVVFSSIIALMPRRRKPPPDPPLSTKLREYHANVCSTLLNSIRSIEHFISRHSKLVKANVHISHDESDETYELTERLETSERPWATLEASAVQLSTKLDVLFDQLIELYGTCSPLMRILQTEYVDQRLRLMGEAFFFRENPLSSLPTAGPSKVSEMHAQVLKGKYLHRLPKCAVFCAETDSPADNCPIIFEELFSRGVSDDIISARSAQSLPIMTPPQSLSNLSMKDGKDGMKRAAKSFRIMRLRKKSEDGLITKKTMKRASLDNGNVLVAVQKVSDILSSESSSPPISLTESILTPPPCTAMPSTSFFSNPVHSADVDQLVELVKEREHTKHRLLTHCSFDGNMYSELAFHSIRPHNFMLRSTLSSVELKKPASDWHLIVFVHGLEGSPEDLAPYRNVLREALTNSTYRFSFKLSSVNRTQTWTDLDKMSKNLIEEVKDHIACDMIKAPTRISFIGHSMGGVIVRAALARPDAVSLHENLHTFMTINTPHLGLAYAGRSIQWGVQFVQWWKRSRSLDQLALRDSLSFSNSFLFKLSLNGVFSKFKNILLIGAPSDLFVPSHSSLLEPCKISSKDASALGTAYRDMLANIYTDILSGDEPRTVVRYSSFHSCASSKSDKIMGRAAHIAAVEDDVFIEKLFAVSALRYFV